MGKVGTLAKKVAGAPMRAIAGHHNDPVTGVLIVTLKFEKVRPVCSAPDPGLRNRDSLAARLLFISSLTTLSVASLGTCGRRQTLRCKRW